MGIDGRDGNTHTLRATAMAMHEPAARAAVREHKDRVGVAVGARAVARVHHRHEGVHVHCNMYQSVLGRMNANKTTR